jgi:hypothetical protein
MFKTSAAIEARLGTANAWQEHLGRTFEFNVLKVKDLGAVIGTEWINGQGYVIQFQVVQAALESAMALLVVANDQDVVAIVQSIIDSRCGSLSLVLVINNELGTVSMPFKIDLMPIAIIDADKADQNQALAGSKVESALQLALINLKDDVVNLTTCLQDDTGRPNCPHIQLQAQVSLD